MSKVMRIVPLVVLCALIIAVPSVWAYWVQDGVALCSATGNQSNTAIVSDGAGGAVVTWQDYRNGTNYQAYAQKVGASGSVQWTANGVALCTTAINQSTPAIASDGAGGAIVTWYAYTYLNPDIYAQRVNASGVVQWTAAGSALCTATGSQSRAAIVSDGAGGAIVTWQDTRSGSSNTDIYAQRVNASGTVQWTANGIVLCAATGNQLYPTIASDGEGGAIITWQDYRSGLYYDIYAQRVNAVGAVLWTANGIALCSATGNQSNTAIVSDGAGGAVVTWQDLRNGTNYQAYAQKVGASGFVQWAANGVALSTATGEQMIPTIVSDGAGGAVVTWQDGRSGNADIYTQRVNAAGAVQWTANGVALCSMTGNQQYPKIVSDGVAGAIVTWQDGRNGNDDIYAQRVNTSGTVQWTANGIALCTATGNQWYPAVASDGAGGANIAWQDQRSGNYDIYAQSVDSRGRVCYFAPDISAVRDVPGDQGGWARITIEKSKLDEALESAYPISMYGIWLRIDDPGLLALIARVNVSSVLSRPVKELDGRHFVQSTEPLAAGEFPAGTWELLGKFAACQDNQYIYRGRTRADSTGTSTPYSVYIVTANTTTPSVWFVSEPDSGYSIDNLSPCTPLVLEGEESLAPVGLRLTWGRNTEADIGEYHVYRGSSESFVPGSSNLIASQCDTTFFDRGWRSSGGYYYKASAIDIHGNESSFALLTPEDVTGTETPKAPEASYLAQNYPNPFNPMTRVAFGLSAPAHVSLKIYDAAGRLIRVLVNEERRAGRYEEVWNGADRVGRKVSSGTYFYQLVAGGFENTRKMILLR